MVELILIFIFYFRYDFGKHMHDENRQYIADLLELEGDRVDHWVDEMNQLAQQPRYMYGDFDNNRFRRLIGIDFVRNFIQDMWVKVSKKEECSKI
jgi:hypothetical protein